MKKNPIHVIFQNSFQTAYMYNMGSLFLSNFVFLLHFFKSGSKLFENAYHLLYSIARKKKG